VNYFNQNKYMRTLIILIIIILMFVI